MAADSGPRFATVPWGVVLIVLAVVLVLGQALFIGLLALVLLANDIVRLIAPSLLSAGPLTKPQRRFVIVRIALTMPVLVAALFVTWRALAAAPILYWGLGAVAAECRSGKWHPGPSWVRLALHITSRGLGSPSEDDSARRVAFTAAICVLGVLCALQLAGETREAIAEAVRGLADDHGLSSAIEKFEREGRSSEESANADAREEHPGDDSDGDLVGESRSLPRMNPEGGTLEEMCLTTQISTAKASDRWVKPAETAWRRLGGFEIGCFTGDVDIVPGGPVVFWFVDADIEYTALVVHEDGRSVFVRRDATRLLGDLIAAGELRAVDHYERGVSSGVQLFHTSRGCMARVNNHGHQRLQLDEALTSSLFHNVQQRAAMLDHLRIQEGDAGPELLVVIRVGDGLESFALRVALDSDSDTWQLATGSAGVGGCPRGVEALIAGALE